MVSLVLVLCAMVGDAPALAPPPPAADTAAGRGYRWLLEKPYLPPDFDQDIFDQLWQRWPEPLRSQAERADPAERRRLAYARYGLTPRPGDPRERPLQYVVDERGQWSMNCFACHGGKVLSQTVPGLPNSHFALETLTEDVRTTKLLLGKKLARMELGSLMMPLGRTNGTTNAVMFGVALLNYRDADLNIFPDRLPPAMTHHDMDAPPWWHFHRKDHIYIDGFAQKGHRGLMQFMLVKENGPAQFAAWEEDFRDVYAYLESLRPPKYPFPLDTELAARGEQVFVQSCARCHGTYGPDGKYPGKMVAIDEIGADRVRFDALTRAHRARYAESWFAEHGQQATLLEPEGYVAPPLDGIWASAPYLHNGSVPTLWHLLHSDQRPLLWRRSENGYDRERVGLEVTTYATFPSGVTKSADRRTIFDTRLTGKSSAGHTFPDELTAAEKRAVLEYLKTL